MTLSEFFDHWGIAENPFQGEEARHDSVFARMGDGGAGGFKAEHSDFSKILGDLSRPSTAIVFGEKGSGKTAIRLQISQHVAAFNAAHPQARVLLVPYDDLNAVLDRFHARMGGKDAGASMAQVRLGDHMDAILLFVVPRLTDALLGKAAEDQALDLPADTRKLLRKMDASGKRDLLVLQGLYDRAEQADLRTAQSRRALLLGPVLSTAATDALAYAGWVPLAGVVAALGVAGQWDLNIGWWIALGGASLLWGIGLVKRFAWDALSLGRLARGLRRHIRVSTRSERSYARSLRALDPVARDASSLPVGESDEPRYAMFERLRRVLTTLGFRSMLIVLDRVDEPTLINGDARLMQPLVWPLFNNKFLQQSGVGVKMLLPIELRHMLFKESAAFFQEARLDKQNLVERLSWTGAMLYDLCNARLQACLRPRGEGSPPAPSLLSLFAEDVTRQDVVDALDQMHQPRDAFKFIYHCLSEHCSNVSVEQGQWRVPKLVLDSVRKHQAERVQGLYRGIRPA